MIQRRALLYLMPTILLLSFLSFSQDLAAKNNGLPTHAELTAAVDAASAGGVNNGGIFSPARVWVAIVDRNGNVIAVTKTTGSDPWPDSRVVAMQKANTANGFSNNGLALSTANLYNPTQPGGSLFGLQESNPVDPDVAYRGNPKHYGKPNDPAAQGNNRRIGGVNVFGGGLPLYDQNTGEVVGGIGVSGDSSCADHVIAWRIRHALGFTKLPGGVNTTNYGGAVPPADGDDNIIFDLTNGFWVIRIVDLTKIPSLIFPRWIISS